MVEDVFWPEGLLEVPGAVSHELEREPRLKLRDKVGVEVGGAPGRLALNEEASLRAACLHVEVERKDEAIVRGLGRPADRFRR
jgi:hypothetical protein